MRKLKMAAVYSQQISRVKIFGKNWEIKPKINSQTSQYAKKNIYKPQQVIIFALGNKLFLGM